MVHTMRVLLSCSYAYIVIITVVAVIMTMMMTSTDFIVAAFHNMPTVTTAPTIISRGSNWSIQSTRLHHNHHHPVTTSSSSTTTKLYSTMKERSRTATTTTASSNKVSDLSKQMKDMQNQLATDNEDANLIMQALRGKNINDDDNQVVGLEMRLIEFDDGGGSSSNNLQGGGESSSSSIGLPYIYDPIALEQFFIQRPQLIVARIFQVLTSGYSKF